MRLLSGDDVRALMPVQDAVPLVRATFIATDTPEVVQPVRTVVRVPGVPAVLGSMPAYLGDRDTGCFGIKTVVVNPENSRIGLDTHRGVVVLFGRSGGVTGIVHAGALTAVRTAAASVVASDALARVESGVVAVLGTGLQARMHLEAMAVSRQVSAVHLWGRDREKVRSLSSWVAQQFSLPVRVFADVADATRQADVVCTVTSARYPLLSRADVRPGVHINAVGSCFPDTRELATDVVAASRVVVDDRRAATVEAGDLLLAARDLGRSLPEPPQLGAVLRNEAAGRTEPGEITVFESLGFAALDVAVGRAVLERAVALQCGDDVPLDEGRSISAE